MEEEREHQNTIFILLCFEGPDVYSTAGGLGTRVSELSEALAMLGYTTHLLFIGDPYKPSTEERVDGRLILKRWSQWVSKYYPNGVYDGEVQKFDDYSESVPSHVCNEIVRPAVASGKMVVIMGEDWQTAEVICRISDLLHSFGVLQKVLMLWNLNDLISLDRINWSRLWSRLDSAATVCTLSEYMRQKMLDFDVTPLVIPNGIPKRLLTPVDPAAVKKLREIAQQGDPRRLFLFKIGRFDTDARWLMAIDTVVRLKHAGHPVTLLIRGGIEPHETDVLHHAYNLGLTIQDVVAKRPNLEQCLEVMQHISSPHIDIYNLRFFLPEEFVRTTCAAADAVLAINEPKPFNPIALETMAAKGIAFTGKTGADYAVSLENAVIIETDDPDEIVNNLLHLQRNPEAQMHIRSAGYETAQQFQWDRIIKNFIVKLKFLAQDIT